ncbi:hypothetical protein M408DRAFT_23629 [Serendipita vermifera MAFF 305830]|uniref:Uncharacterized protein n=1 Tax=Serendipita vermifera MAFF 305830 TaxID=933852 RepID=A0A0C3B8Z1_SERVB|nr:hypothetical protein M408DRAFT_23629 [Serendipita vermifera MAFF 305830]
MKEEQDIAIVVTSEGNTPSGSGAVTLARAPPTTAKPTANNTISGFTTVSTASTACVINTTTVKVSRRFMPIAEDLWGLFTGENGIPIWTRASLQSKPVPGSPFSSFSGGMAGEYLELEP